jgi:ATP-binding cassette, subfamily G (WHITE), member 2
MQLHRCSSTNISLSHLSAVANIGCVLIFILMLVFSGFLIDLKSVFDWLSWIQWISAFRYALNTVTINEFRNNITFCLANASNVCPLTGSDVLDQRGFDHATDWDLWKNFFALCMMTTTFLLLAYIQLIRIKKTK